MKNPVTFLRHTGLVEGLSFLLLVFLAMPLKYIWGQPAAVRIIGMAHGVLFILLLAALARVMLARRWPLGRAALVFAASLLPLGPFLIDRRMKLWENEDPAEKLP